MGTNLVDVMHWFLFATVRWCRCVRHDRHCHKLCRLYPKQGIYFHLFSSAFEGSPLPPPLRRRRLWMAPKEIKRNPTNQVPVNLSLKPTRLLNVDPDKHVTVWPEPI